MTVSPFHPAQLALGLIIWSVYFVAVYSGLSIGCSLQAPDADQGPRNWLNLSLLLLTLTTAGWLLWQAYRCWRTPARAHQPDSAERASREPGSEQLAGFRKFIASIALGVNLVAGIATLAIGMPLTVLAPCQ